MQHSLAIPVRRDKHPARDETNETNEEDTMERPLAIKERVSPGTMPLYLQRHTWGCHRTNPRSRASKCQPSQCVCQVCVCQVCVKRVWTRTACQWPRCPSTTCRNFCLHQPKAQHTCVTVLGASTHGLHHTRARLCRRTPTRVVATLQLALDHIQWPDLRTAKANTWRQGKGGRDSRWQEHGRRGQKRDRKPGQIRADGT